MAPDYHDTPASRADRERSRRIVGNVIAAAAPRATARQRAFAVDLIFMTMTAVGERLSDRHPSKVETDRMADAIASMLASYLAQLEPRVRRSNARGV